MQHVAMQPLLYTCMQLQPFFTAWLASQPIQHLLRVVIYFIHCRISTEYNIHIGNYIQESTIYSQYIDTLIIMRYIIACACMHSNASMFLPDADLYIQLFTEITFAPKNYRLYYNIAIVMQSSYYYVLGLKPCRSMSVAKYPQLVVNYNQ